MQRAQHSKKTKNAASGALIEAEGRLELPRYTARTGWANSSLSPHGLTVANSKSMSYDEMMSEREPVTRYMHLLPMCQWQYLGPQATAPTDPRTTGPKGRRVRSRLISQMRLCLVEVESRAGLSPAGPLRTDPGLAAGGTLGRSPAHRQERGQRGSQKRSRTAARPFRRP